MSVEIAWKQNILVTDFHLLKSLLVVLGFGSQAFVCGFSRQNINSARSQFHLMKYHPHWQLLEKWKSKMIIASILTVIFVGT